MTDQTTTTETPTVGDNSADAMKNLRGELRKLGSAEAMGSAARPIAGRRLVDAAYDGLLKEGDAEMIYGEYQAGLIAAGKKSPLSLSSGATEKVQISKFRQLIKVGMLPGVDARTLMDRIAAHIASCKQAEIAIVSPFDAMLNAARTQLSQPELDLTDEQVATACEKPERASKEEIDKLIDVYKKAASLQEKLPAPSGEATIQALRDWITEKGGTVPPVTKEEKEAFEFAKKAATYGFVPRRDTSGAEDTAFAAE